jgi:DNA-binding CsgD family transcriptional regulator
MTDAMGLVGRDTEVGLIRETLRQEPDVPRALLFRGDPGVGKTALLDLAVAEARTAGFRIVTIRGSEFQADIAYSGLNQLVSALEPEATTLPAAQREALRVVYGDTPPESANKLAVFSAISALLVAASRDQRLLVCVDDAHCFDFARADGVSGEGIAFFASRLGNGNVSAVGAARSFVGVERDAPGTRVRFLEPLDAEASDTLLRTRFPHLSRRVRARILESAQGNPLALLELPVALGDRGADELTPFPLPLTHRLLRMYAARAHELPPETRELLLLAALDDTGQLDVVRRAGSVCNLEAIGAAEDAGIVRIEEGDRLVFTHPLMRSALAESATAGERREAHRRLAVALEWDPDRRARHLAAATIEPDEDVARTLEDAAHRATETSPGTTAATRLLIRAADLSTTASSRRRRMAEAAFLVASRQGDRRLAPSILQKVATVEPGSDDALFAIAATAFVSVEDGDELDSVFSLVDDALRAATDAGNTASAAFAAAVETLYSICALAHRSEYSQRFREVLGVLPPGPPAAGLRLAEAMLDPARTFTALAPVVDDAVVSNELTGPQAVSLGSAALYLDRLGACRPALERLVSDPTAAAAEDDIRLRHLLWTEAFQSGRWTAADAIAVDGERLSHSRGTGTWSELFACQSAVLAGVRGDRESTVEAAESVLAGSARRGYGVLRTGALWTLCLEAFSRRDYSAAFDYATQISPPGELRADTPIALWVFFELVVSAVRLRRMSDAQAHVETLQRLRIAQISPRYALLTRAAEATLFEDPGESSRHLSPALHDPELERWPFDRARVQLLQGELLLATGAQNEARALVVAASRTLFELGARPWMDQASELLARAGGSGARAKADGLTATERKVARLAAGGLTNKEIGARLFLSERTVATHLYRAFPKLKITRRAALRDALSGLETRPQYEDDPLPDDRDLTTSVV